MQKLTHVTPDTGEMTNYLEGWYLTSTEAGDHASGIDDVVKGRSPFRMPAGCILCKAATVSGRRPVLWHVLTEGRFSHGR